MATQTSPMVRITGNTYPVKDQIKALGGRWDADNKVWTVPESKAEEARQLVNGAPVEKPATPGKCRKCGASCKAPYTLCWDCKPAPTQCTVCGHKPRYGDKYDRIYKSGECRDCYEERKMGY